MNDQPIVPPQTELPDQSYIDAPNLPVETKKKPSKGLLGVLIAVGVVVLLAIIGILIYIVFFYISKDDYTRAAAQTDTVTMAGNELSVASDDYFQAVNNELTTDSQVASKQTDYGNADTAYQTAVTSLSSEKALGNSNVKVAYTAFVAKNKVFIANNSTLTQSMPLVRKATLDCSKSKIGVMDTSDLSKVVAAYDKAVGPCTDAMKDLSTAKNVDAATLGKNGVKYFAGMRTDIVAMQASYIAKNRTLFETDYNAFVAKAKLLTAETDLSSIQKHQDSLFPKLELARLTTAIRSRE